MPRKSLRAGILDAAEKIIARRGAATTLEAIAIEAGVSKGGLLYHFPGKRELLFALIDRYEERIAEAEARVTPDLPDEPGKALKAYVLTRSCKGMTHKMPPSRLVAFLDDPKFRDVVAGSKRRAFAKILSGGISPEFAAIIVLAIDGLWLQDILGVDVFPRNVKTRLTNEILHLIGREGGRKSGRGARPKRATERE